MRANKSPTGDDKTPVARSQTSKTSWRYIQSRLFEALEQDESRITLASALITNALPVQSSTDPAALLTREIAARFPDRLFGVGDYLADLVPTVTRLHREGKKCLVLVSSDDLARSYSSLSALCTQHLPVTLLVLSGSSAGQTWRSEKVNDLAILRTLPGMHIGLPASPVELLMQLAEAETVQDNPVALYLEKPGRATRTSTLTETYSKPPGVGKAVMLRQGKDLALLAGGATSATALALATYLETKGYQAAVINVRWARPLDEALLNAIANYFPCLVTLEEGSLEAGLGAAILEMLEQNSIYETHLKRLQVFEQVEIRHLAGQVQTFVDAFKPKEGFSTSLFNPKRLGGFQLP